MKNVKLQRAKNGKGWFLEIEKVGRFALTALELLVIKKIISDNEIDLLAQLEETEG